MNRAATVVPFTRPGFRGAELPAEGEEKSEVGSQQTPRPSPAPNIGDLIRTKVSTWTKKNAHGTDYMIYKGATGRVVGRDHAFATVVFNRWTFPVEVPLGTIEVAPETDNPKEAA